ncbi:spermatogenesis-associated protein 1 [Caerostris darwini]|uniref:Spermatogenesis-associated protein 1 n=1 Tax=Caerostris darwini TaxID=1538125 RepID=A0AAV4MYA4_9ARAC|nr:spermatogenesis-associated protein 1 [Caerostris darwini]
MVDVNPVNEEIEEFQENERPPSEQLVELHLYLVPKEKWLEKRKLAKNQAVDHTISVGFVRVLPQTHLSDLRKEINRQLGIDSVPQTFVFLRSVGRNFTQVRPKQEMEMKVKNYVPPFVSI